MSVNHSYHLRFCIQVLCNGDEVDLKPGVDFVTYENRLEYLELVKEKKMCEFDEQVRLYFVRQICHHHNLSENLQQTFLE